MRNKKKWIISGAAAVLLAAGGVSMLAGSEPAPLTHEEILQKNEDKFGKPPAPPTTAPVPLENPAAVPLENPGDAARAVPMPTGEGFKETLEQSAEQRDWQKAELEKQQILFAEHAPSPMPTGHSSYVVSGKQP
jgi:hypothetical protein